MPPFNDENMIMLARRGAGGGARRSAQRFERDSRAFHAAIARDRAAAVAAAATLRAERAGARQRLRRARRWAADQTFAIIDAITSKALRARFTDYAGSVQAVMATDTLLSALVNEGQVPPGAANAHPRRHQRAPIARCTIPMPTIPAPSARASAGPRRRSEGCR